jgi:hypothetical protein
VHLDLRVLLIDHIVLGVAHKVRGKHEIGQDH